MRLERDLRRRLHTAPEASVADDEVVTEEGIEGEESTTADAASVAGFVGIPASGIEEVSAGGLEDDELSLEPLLDDESSDVGVSEDLPPEGAEYDGSDAPPVKMSFWAPL